MSTVRSFPPAPGTLLCPRCGATLREDQSWCLECGLAARTRVHPPPSWRLPVVLTCVALALLAAGIAVGLVALLGNPTTSSTVPATVTVPAATPTATTPLQTAPATTPTATTPPQTAPTTTAPPDTTPTATTPTTTTSPSGRALTVPGTTTPTGAVK